MMKIFKYLDGNKAMRTAPKAEVRYANSRVVPGARYAGAPADKVQQNVLTNITGGGMLPAHILRYIPINGDTTYVELPEALSYMFKPTARYERSASFKNPKGLEYNILKRRFNTAWGVAKHQEGGEFKENLNPPTNGVVGEIKRNLRNGWQQSKRIASSIPLNILLGGIGAGATNVNLASKGKQFANWLVKDENPGLELLSALGWIGSGPAMGVAMFDPFGWAPDKKNEKEVRKYGASSRYDRERRAEEYRSTKPIRH